MTQPARSRPAGSRRRRPSAVHRAASCAAAAAVLQQLRTGGAVQGTVDTAAAEQGGVRRVDHRVDHLQRQVARDHLDAHDGYSVRCTAVTPGSPRSRAAVATRSAPGASRTSPTAHPGPRRSAVAGRHAYGAVEASTASTANAPTTCSMAPRAWVTSVAGARSIAVLQPASSGHRALDGPYQDQDHQGDGRDDESDPVRPDARDDAERGRHPERRGGGEALDVEPVAQDHPGAEEPRPAATCAATRAGSEPARLTPASVKAHAPSRRAGRVAAPRAARAARARTRSGHRRRPTGQPAARSPSRSGPPRRVAQSTAVASTVVAEHAAGQ